MTAADPKALGRLLENPYGPDRPSFERAAAAVREGDPPRTLEEAFERGGPDAALDAALAIAHAQALLDPTAPAAVLRKTSLPARVTRAVPDLRAGVLPLAMAAARARHALDDLAGTSAAMGEVRRTVWAACFGHSLRHARLLGRLISDHDVLILGETGTGKERIAAAIQAGTVGGPNGRPAPRGDLNAASVPDTLVASELFGHVRGAFTGALTSRPGRLRAAHGGSFFLDEVGDLEPTTQVKLLRVMETDEVTPLGAETGERVSVRYLAATHKDLSRMVEEGGFRADLYQRIAGTVVSLPPLRERPEDVVAIGSAFLATHLPPGADELRPRIERWLADAAESGHRWPGNVRELHNALRNLCLGLPVALATHPAPRRQDVPPGSPPPEPIATARASLAEVERWYVDRVLDRLEGNVAAAARVLGVDRGTVQRKRGPRP